MVLITTHAGSTSPRGRVNTQAKEETIEPRAVAAATATGPEDSDDRLPIDSVMMECLPAVPDRSPHAMPYKAVPCLQQTLDRSALRQGCFLWVCYTAHICLPLYAPSLSEASVVLL